MRDHWLAERTRFIQASGIRRVFDLARELTNPINLSIGQPHFDVPTPIKESAIAAILAGHNGYTVTQGIPELRDKIRERVRQQLPQQDREVLITSGTSGGLVLAVLTCVNPGDEVIIFDPYFVMYPHLVRMAGGIPVFVDTYPDFQIDPERVRRAITPRTKMILFNSPANPTGTVTSRERVRALAELAEQQGLLLVSDEVYRAFCYDSEFTSPAVFNPEVLVLDGFSKAYGMTGWRLGYAHGPKRLIEEMAKLQQFTFVCAPSMVQHAGITALDYDVSPIVADYRRKRDLICQALREHYELVTPQGAFYAFPKVPWGSDEEFVTACIQEQLLVIPGSVFSQRSTHFRISFAADDETLHRGIEVLLRLAKR
ncbi:MAG: pyridoxal phosphate-dependent aminotransferase [Gemmatales bacterium]|nr:pyridoxal phosphate-dependent aminotransferase [Gemmatales bacterium]MDW7995426.1 pyridoxal phosphate-dependent aminotransferase [Gemmatales bacterium]